MNAQILFIVCFSSLAGVGIALTTCAGLMLFLCATATQNPVVTEPLKKQEPAVPGSAKLPTNFSLRKLLGAVLKTSTDLDRKSTRLNSSHLKLSRMPSSA